MLDAPPLERHSGNPILTPTARWWEDRWVFNSAATLYQGDVILLYRAQGQDWISRLGLARLRNGVEVIERSPQPVFEPAVGNEWERLGTEDPRVTAFDGRYYICYTAASLYPATTPVRRTRPSPFADQGVPWRVRIGIATTKDFKRFRRIGLAFRQWDNKNGVLFPAKIRGKYYLLHRIFPNVHLGVSNDLRRWHNLGPLLPVRPGMWDSNRVGAGAPPLRTPYGWLLFYHGVDESRTYRLGMALLDLAHPRHVLARAHNPILEPVESYEREGLVPNVVFTCGAVELGDRFFVYYGGADSVIGAATVSREAVMRWAGQAVRSAPALPDHVRRAASREAREFELVRRASG
ncbi:MAG: glycosidase [Armatimonadetes bacterium]|nr:glycosidase [Armatimonadota bacterium]